MESAPDDKTAECADTAAKWRVRRALEPARESGVPLNKGREAGTSGGTGPTDALRSWLEDGELPEPDALGDFLSGRGPSVVWEALEALHAELDRQHEDGLPLEEVSVRRAHLVGLGRALVEAGIGSEVTAHRELLRDVSHDIRSPLNSILFLTEGLYSQRGAGLSASQKRQIGIVYAAAASLLNLVNDLLDFARTSEGDVGGVAEVPFGLPTVVTDLKRLVTPLSDHHRTDLRIEIETSGARRGDPQVLYRLLINLVSNAIEAAGEGGSVELALRDTEDGGLGVTVSNDGSGADIEAMRAMLEPQSEGTLTRRLRGRTHGLGLVICGRLVRAAGGSLELEGNEDGGARFSVELPFPRL